MIGSRCRLRRSQRLPIVRLSRKELYKFMFLASTDVCSLGCSQVCRAPGFGGTVTKTRTPYPAPKTCVAN